MPRSSDADFVPSESETTVKKLLTRSLAGARLLTDLADKTGSTSGFVQALGLNRQRRPTHEPGRVAVELAVLVADGGEAITDLAMLRQQGGLFGPVASDPTAWRRIRRRNRRRRPENTPSATTRCCVFLDATGEALAGMPRPGNAGSNTAADHITVLNQALRQIPDAKNSLQDRHFRASPAGVAHFLMNLRG